MGKEEFGSCDVRVNNLMRVWLLTREYVNEDKYPFTI